MIRATVSMIKAYHAMMLVGSRTFHKILHNKQDYVIQQGIASATKECNALSKYHDGDNLPVCIAIAMLHI
jgi:hypothetical protein